MNLEIKNFFNEICKGDDKSVCYIGNNVQFSLFGMLECYKNVGIKKGIKSPNV